MGTSLIGGDVAGMVSAYALEFYRATDDGLPDTARDPALSVDSGDYFADVEFSAGVGERGPSFEISIEGLSDQDAAKLLAPQENSNAGAARFVRIQLGWADIPDAIFPVVLGRILEVERTAGSFRYLTSIRGEAWQTFRARTFSPKTVTPSSGDAMPLAEVAKTLLEPAGITDVAANLPPAAEQTQVRRFTVAQSETVAGALQRWRREVGGEGRGRALPAYVRGLTFQLGHPDAAASPPTLELATGLIEAKPKLDTGQRETEESDDPLAPLAPDQLTYDATLLGRPDIFVGDVVSMEVDPIAEYAGGALGAVGVTATPVEARFRVVSVTHTLSRRNGFTSTLRLEPVPEGSAETTRQTHRSLSSEPAEHVADTIEHALAEATARAREIEIGDVYEQDPKGDAQPGAQRVSAVAGLDRTKSSDDRPSTAGLAQGATAAIGIPYLSPFAFGATGLVMPRYPGMRVAMLKYDGNPDHSLITGSLWLAGEAPKSDPGDWWLSLPVDFEPSTSSNRDETVKGPTSGKACHDLIDKSGRRVIQVRAFTIEIGESSMTNVGRRPNVATDDSIVIRHESANASVTINADGSIEIRTDENLTLESGKTIEMKAADVKVSVSNAMEVT